VAIVTKTLKTSGGDYSSFQTWESTEQTDLVAAGDSHVLEISAGEYIGGGTVGAWTTDATHTITIKAAAGSEHGGIWGAGAKLSVAGAAVLNISQAYVLVQDIELQSGVDASGNCLAALGDPSYYTGLLIGNDAATRAVVGGVTVISSGYFHNCVIKNFNRGYYSLVSSAPVKNCTFIGNNYGAYVSTAPAFPASNCVGFDNDSLDFFQSKAGGWTGSGNASEDASAPGTAPITGIVAADFYNFAGGDYRAVEGGALDGSGADLSGTFTTDITGATRSTPWDVGAWIAVAAPAGGGDGFGGIVSPVAASLVDAVAMDITHR